MRRLRKQSAKAKMETEAATAAETATPEPEVADSTPPTTTKAATKGSGESPSEAATPPPVKAEPGTPPVAKMELGIVETPKRPVSSGSSPPTSKRAALSGEPPSEARLSLTKRLLKLEPHDESLTRTRAVKVEHQEPTTSGGGRGAATARCAGGSEEFTSRLRSALSSLATSLGIDVDGDGGDASAALGVENRKTLQPELVRAIDKYGKLSEFTNFVRQEVTGGEPKTDEELIFTVSTAIYDLLQFGVQHKLKKDLIITALKDIAPLHDEMPSIILDVLNVVDTETSVSTEPLQEERFRFGQILKDLEKVIDLRLIKERLEIDTLQEFGIVKNKVFYTKFIKIKTKLYYKQRRYNLFREESEGYAKLITELNQDFEEDVSTEYVMKVITSLIGCFNLDPNRVLDIIVESFEAHPDRWPMFIPLLRLYMPNGKIICEVLGYKYRHFADEPTPKSLLQVSALLLKHGVIKLDDLNLWLSPTYRAIIEDWQEELAAAKEYARKANVVVTNKDAVEPESTDEPVYDEEKFLRNQKFGLCEALLKVGDWEDAFKIIKQLPEFSVVVHESIAQALAPLIHVAIDYVYRVKSFKCPTRKSYPCEDTKLLNSIQARDFAQLRQHAIPMITTLGPSIHFDTVLMYKLVRIYRTVLSEMGVDALNGPPADSEAENLYYDVMTVMDTALLPALGYLDCNCPIAEEIWSVLRYFPYHFRYSLYARLKNETYLLNPLMIRRRVDGLKKIKALMKRVSKENVKPVGRLIGKLTHCAAGYLFDYVLLQIQIYDNLIGPVVDSLKYLTALSFDCMGYCLIEALSKADRDRFKHDGTSISLWLQSLASFCGAVFKKYNIELSGLLQYVANQLKSQKSLDLLILKEVVQKMAGVESAEEMTNEQLSAMCGGELLRGEAGYFSQVRNTKKSSQRLKDALANNDLAVGLCLLMAQQKHCVIYRETAQSHLKLVGKLYDQCQDTLVQFGTFLGSTYSVDEYVERLPSIIAMLQDYHINADVAFFLARPMFSHQINQKYDQLRKADPNSKKLTSQQKLQKYLEATSLIMNPIVESVRPLHGPKVWEDISPQFLVTFWSLSMYDLQVPADTYQREINKLKQLSVQAAESKESNNSKNKKEQERYIALMDKLQDERKKQQEHVDKILQRLQQQKDNWFLSRSAKSAKNDTITQFLQLCLFPRCTFTALDALYCAKFVHTIHNLKSANFSTLLCYDRIFCDITYCVTSCTENEATRYGRFLCALLETVMRWHGDQAIFNKECTNYPGFVTKFRVSNQNSEATDHVGYENYRHVCHKWHYKITKAMVFCLDSKDYMQIRNALIILMRILPHYPVLSKLAQIIERKVEKVREEERSKRPDLFVIASSYIGQLKSKTAQFIKESDFHQISDRPLKAEPNDEDAQAAASAIAIGASAALVSTSVPASLSSQSASANVILSVPVTPPLNLRTSLAQDTVSPPPMASTASSTPTYATESNSVSNVPPRSSTPTYTSLKVINGETKNAEKREREKIKLAKTTLQSSEKDGAPSYASGSVNSNSSGNSSAASGRNNVLIEVKDEVNLVGTTAALEREQERLSLREKSTRILKKRTRSRDRARERDRERERNERDREHHREETHDFSSVSAGAFSSIGSSGGGGSNLCAIAEHYERDADRELRGRERERDRDRDLSSVSNESNTSMHRRTQEVIEYDKDLKRRKVETSSSSSNYKKHAAAAAADDLELSKKDRSSKGKERKDKDKLTDEERDARRERKMGRKRERLEDGSVTEHKRRRDVQNGEEDMRDRDRDKYHLRGVREKSPHVRESREHSHEKFERGSRDDRVYGPVKSTRSRLGY